MRFHTRLLAALLAVLMGHQAVALDFADPNFLRVPSPDLNAPKVRRLTLPPTDQGSTGEIGGMSATLSGLQRTLGGWLSDYQAQLALPSRREIDLDQVAGGQCAVVVSACASITDWSPILAQAYARLGEAGGRIRLATTHDYPIATSTTVPSQVTLDLGRAHIDTSGVKAGHGTFGAIKGIVLSPSATIRLGATGGIINGFVRRLGWATTDVLPTNYAGTAITLAGYGAYAHNLLIIGFDKAIAPDTTVLSGQFSRVFLTNLFIDANNGIELLRSADVNWLQNIEGWPFGTIEAYAAQAAGDRQIASILRPGTFLKSSGGMAGGLIDGVTGVGWFIGADLSVGSTMNIGRLRMETPPFQPTGNIGIKLGNNLTNVVIASLALSGYETQVDVDTVDTTRTDITYAYIAQGIDVLRVKTGNIKFGELVADKNSGSVLKLVSTTPLVEMAAHVTNHTGTYLDLPTGARTDRVKVDLRTGLPNGASIISSGTLIDPGTSDSGGVVDLAPVANSVSLSSTAALTTINGGWTGREVDFLITAQREMNNSGNIVVASPITLPVGTRLKLRCGADGNWRAVWLPRALSRSMANQSATCVAPPQSTGVAIIRQVNTAAAYGMIHFRAGTASQAVANLGTAGVNFALGAAGTALTGTTGAANRLTVAPDNTGLLCIENQLGAAVEVRIEFLD